MASADYKGIVDFAQAIDDTYVRKDAPSVPVGGAKGEVLRKKSSTDGDAEWANPLYHFSTLAEMQAALALGQIPDGANVSVEEEQPGGNTGDTALDTTSENWVQNKVVAAAVEQISSDLTNKAKISVDYIHGTTDAYGIVKLTTNGKPILFAMAEAGSYYCIVGWGYGAEATTQWLKVFYYDGTVAANLTTNFYYYYLDS
jgi:hypothetical protein